MRTMHTIVYIIVALSSLTLCISSFMLAHYELIYAIPGVLSGAYFITLVLNYTPLKSKK